MLEMTIQVPELLEKNRAGMLTGGESVGLDE